MRPQGVGQTPPQNHLIDMGAKTLMVMGTASDVGKSIVATALCRIFARAGIRVAPFKSQNMSNNAAVCQDGGEIGRAQAVQAEACGLEPTVDMNPVLLKPETDLRCQVVIHGRARFHIGAAEHRRYRIEAWPAIVTSYGNLAERFELIVIEGAGGAAEINLRDRDVVNWPIAELADAPVIIVADIDKGGVFASLVGTFELLSPGEKKRLRGFIINKFRGERVLLEAGLRLLLERTGVPVLGVLPYHPRLGIPQEDSAALDGLTKDVRDAPVKVGVLHFPRISNYTDFQPLEDEPDVTVHYLSDPSGTPPLDLLILPGSKSTVADLKWFRSAGWEDYIVRHRRAGGWVLGICGGYQMLGERIRDDDRVESEQTETVGLGILPVETRFQRIKITERVAAVHLQSGLPVEGYEIHCGRIIRTIPCDSAFRVIKRGGDAADNFEGACSHDKRVVGTSIHGIFESSEFRRHLIDSLRQSKGLGVRGPVQHADSMNHREMVFDRLADMFERHVDMRCLAAIAGFQWKSTN